MAHYVHHDVLLEDGPPFAIALVAFLLAWQLMIAAMMLPSSLPLIRMFGAARRASRGRARRMAGFLGGYALVWSAFGALALRVRPRRAPQRRLLRLAERRTNG